MATGVALGATKLKELWVLTPESPTSAKVGNLGNEGVLYSLAKATSLPELTKAKDEAVSGNMNLIWPASKS